MMAQADHPAREIKNQELTLRLREKMFWNRIKNKQDPNPAGNVKQGDVCQFKKDRPFEPVTPFWFWCP